MSKAGSWGDGTTLASAASLYMRSIVIVTDTKSTFTIDSPTANINANPNPIILGYLGVGLLDPQIKNHYVSLSPKNTTATCVETRVTESGSSDDIINRDRTVESVQLAEVGIRPTELSEYGDTDSEVHQPPITIISKQTSAFAKQGGKVKDSTKIVAKRKAEYSWLVPVEGGALCDCCSKFYSDRTLPRNHSDVFINKPFSNWSKSTGSKTKDNKLLKHQQSVTHLAAATFYKDGQQMSAGQRTVYSIIHKQSKEEKEFQLERLTDFADVAYYLFKEEIPHTTHYDSLLALVSRLDGSNQIQKFMDTSPANATYTSNATATELLTAVSQWITNNIFDRARSSKFLAILADESTDIRTRNELSVCFRFVENGIPVETFLRLKQVQSTQAESIKQAIKEILLSANIPLERVYWMAFDGAANMSGRTNGVQAKLKAELLVNAHYIHCRSHLLNLAAANVARDIKPLHGIFSSFNSLWKFFHNSPIRHNKLVNVRNILNDPGLELVRVGDTRWTSNYRAVRAVRTSIEGIVITLQEIHACAGDLSSEAGGLLLTYQDQTSILLIHVIEEILHPINILTLALQSPKLSLADLPEKVDLTIARLREISDDCCTYSNAFEQLLADAKFPTIGTPVNIGEVHSKIVQPYISTLCKNIDKRFGDAAGNVSIAATIFNPGNVDINDMKQQQEHVRTLTKFFGMPQDSAVTEWVCFRNYLLKHRTESCGNVLKSLLTTDVGDSYPQLCQLAGIVLACPVGTAGVERSFSTMNRLCSRLRQRLTVEHLNDLLLIAQEGPEKVTRDQLKEIVYVWFSQKPRRIQLPNIETFTRF